MLEDDESLREEILLPGLHDYGFDVAGAGSAGELYRTLLARRFDLAVLDIGLPDESGLSVVGHLRQLLPDLGIVMLTANSAREDRIDALSQGVDAYLQKPADVEALALTLRNLLRRLRGAVAATPLRASIPGYWQLQSDGWCLAAPGGRIAALTVSERSVLRQLDLCRGQAVSREKLIASLVEDINDFDPHRLEMLVHRLRRKAAGIAGDGPAFPLMSSRGLGYLLAE